MHALAPYLWCTLPTNIDATAACPPSWPLSPATCASPPCPSLPWALQVLEMRECGLQAVPSSVAGLTQLRSLLLGYNAMTEVWVLPSNQSIITSMLLVNVTMQRRAGTGAGALRVLPTPLPPAAACVGHVLLGMPLSPPSHCRAPARFACSGPASRRGLTWRASVSWP